MEWTIPPQDVELLQGDILANRPKPGKLPARMFVVVTADCDIAQNKFGTHLACLRVIWYSDYVQEIWSASELERMRGKASKVLVEQLRSAHKAMTGVESTISNARALEWVEEATPEDIAEALSVPVDARKKFVRNLSKIHAGLKAAADAKTAFQKCIAFKAGIEELSVDAAAEKIMIEARRADLPDDVFILPGLPGFEERPAAVLLRQLVALPATEVVMSRSDATNDAHCVRVGRLVDTFKYALSQAFGHLYARIGLPETYEIRRRDARAAIDHKEWA